MLSQCLFPQLHPTLQQAVLDAGGKYREIHPEEPFFPTQEIAEEWAAAQGYQSGYTVDIIVILALPNGERVGLTTTAQHNRAHQQALIYMRAHSRCAESKGVMFEAWEIRFPPDSYN